MAPEYAKTENGFEMAKMLPLFQKAVKEAETMQEPESISVRCIAEAPQKKDKTKAAPLRGKLQRSGADDLLGGISFKKEASA